jgi:Fe-S-cluster containining protein
MDLPQKVAAVEKVFRELDAEIAQFQSSSTLHCGWGCGKCCFKPDIEATVLEFLPFALYLYGQDRALDWLSKLDETDSSICLILNPTQAGAGLCSEYPHRGLICRLFGYSARTNKYGANELVTCQIIKTEQAEAFRSAEEKIAEGMPVPVMNQFYMQLLAIDADLATVSYPINQAIRKAIETVLHYYAYRGE